MNELMKIMLMMLSLIAIAYSAFIKLTIGMETELFLQWQIYGILLFLVSRE